MSLDYIDVAGKEQEGQDSLTRVFPEMPIDDSIPTETEASRETASNTLQHDGVDEKEQMTCCVDEPEPSLDGEKGPIAARETGETRDALIHSTLQFEESIVPSKDQASHVEKEKQTRYSKGASSYADKAKQMRQKMEERKLQRASVIVRSD
jgi:hypothetical protein